MVFFLGVSLKLQRENGLKNCRCSPFRACAAFSLNPKLAFWAPLSPAALFSSLLTGLYHWAEAINEHDTILKSQTQLFEQMNLSGLSLVRRPVVVQLETIFLDWKPCLQKSTSYSCFQSTIEGYSSSLLLKSAFFPDLECKPWLLIGIVANWVSSDRVNKAPFCLDVSKKYFD